MVALGTRRRGCEAAVVVFAVGCRTHFSGVGLMVWAHIRWWHLPFSYSNFTKKISLSLSPYLSLLFWGVVFLGATVAFLLFEGQSGDGGGGEWEKTRRTVCDFASEFERVKRE